MGSDDCAESQFTRSYGKGPPWLFKGRALYQLHLVKAETARKLIPNELKLVEAFGYTLGGLFLGRYDASPAGAFDELVVISGIVWNPPTSCAWAARVLVSSRKACEHGRKEVGLPSHFAEFSKISVPCARPATPVNEVNGAAIAIREIGDDGAATPLCSIGLPSPGERKSWMGPTINFFLPNFSGRTELYPQLLKYSCRLKCRVRPITPSRVTVASSGEDEERGKSCLNDVWEVLRSRPVLALEFSSLEMLAGAPSVVAPRPPTAAGAVDTSKAGASSSS